jgi:hypothetical protein
MTPADYDGPIFFDIIAREEAWLRGVCAGQWAVLNTINPYTSEPELAETWLEGWYYGRGFRRPPLGELAPL